MRIHYLQHVPFEGPAAITDWAFERGHEVGKTFLFQEDGLPGTGEFDWLVVMGGPMGTDEVEKFPWLTDEKLLIEKSIENGKTVIGICLGAQLIAEVLGANIFKNQYAEIGWFPVTLTPEARLGSHFGGFPQEFNAFHWHRNTFDIPSGARQIGFSEGCRNQVFQYGNTVTGLQFHLETTENSASQLLENCSGDLTEGKYIQNRDEILSDKTRFTGIGRLLYQLLDSMANYNSPTKKLAIPNSEF